MCSEVGEDEGEDERKQLLSFLPLGPRDRGEGRIDRFLKFTIGDEAVEGDEPSENPSSSLKGVSGELIAVAPNGVVNDWRY